MGRVGEKARGMDCQEGKKNWGRGRQRNGLAGDSESKAEKEGQAGRVV